MLCTGMMPRRTVQKLYAPKDDFGPGIKTGIFFALDDEKHKVF